MASPDPMASREGLLGEIVARKRTAVAARRAARPLGDLPALADRQRRSLADALRPSAPERVRLLAELKRASPVAGPLARGFDPVECAPAYVAAGAAALSVHPDPHFQGELADLLRVRAAVDVPLLQKDFVLDPYQIREALDAGADAVLLIVAILEEPLLRGLYREARRLGLDVLVEVHDEGELDRALALDARLIGVNNRDLTTFRTDLAVTERLAKRVPAGVTLVSESGIGGRADVIRVVEAGAQAVLVGEALSRSGDPGRKVAELLGRS